MMAEELLILASGSPRRRELLGFLDVPFTVDAPEVNEDCPLGARAAVAELSTRKALAASRLHPGHIILAADTLVALDDAPLGKPKDEADAMRMLRLLSGRWHDVHTGVCVVDASGRVLQETDSTAVRFGEMTDRDRAAYIATGEPLDKAGAYALQGRAGMWIEEIRGSASNVIGLPLTVTRRLLCRCGMTVPGQP